MSTQVQNINESVFIGEGTTHNAPVKIDEFVNVQETLNINPPFRIDEDIIVSESLGGDAQINLVIRAKLKKHFYYAELII